MLRARDEDLLPVDDVAVAASHRRRLDARGLGAGLGLGHAERLEAQLAFGDLRQIAPLLLVAAVTKQRAHRVHLRVRGRGVAAGCVDLLDDQRRLCHTETGAAVLGRDQRAEPARLGERVDESLRVLALGSRSRQYSSGNCAQSARIAARTDSCSSVRPKSILLARHGNVRLGAFRFQTIMVRFDDDEGAVLLVPRCGPSRCPALGATATRVPRAPPSPSRACRRGRRVRQASPRPAEGVSRDRLARSVP